VWHGKGDTPIRLLAVNGQVGGASASGGETPGAPAPSSGTRTVSVTASGARISLALPTACIARGGTFRARLSWKKIKQKGNVFVKITRTDFYVGTRVVKIDRKAPFVQTLRVPTTAARGRTLTVRARAFIKVKKGKSPKKSIRASIRVCA
jgi:hypothetical protein